MPTPSQAQIELDPRPERLLDITMCGHPAQSTGVVNLFLLLGNRHYQLVERVHGSRNDRTSDASGGNRDGCFYRPCTRLPFPEGCFHVTEHGDYWIAAAAPDATEGGALAPVTENTPLPPPEALTTSGRTEKDKKKAEAEDVVSVEEQSVHSQVASSSSSSHASHGADAELHLEKPKQRKRKHGDEEIKKSHDKASQEKDTKRASADASDAKATEREDREASDKHTHEKEKKKEKHKHRDDKEEEKRRRKEKKKTKKAEKKARKEEKKRRKAEKALRASAAGAAEDAVDAVEKGKPAAAAHSTARNETQDGTRATTPETQPAFQEIVLGIEEDTALTGPAPASPKASPSLPQDAVGKPPASKAAPAAVEPPQKTTALQAAGNAKRRPRLPSPTTSSSSTASSSPTSTAPPPPRQQQQQQQQQQPQQPPFRKQRSETSAQNTPRHSGAAMAPEDKVRSWQTTPVMPLSPALDASMAAAKQPSQPTSRAPSGTTPRTGPAPPTPAQKGRDGKPRNTSDGPSRSRPASTKVTPQHAPSTPQQPHSYAAYGPPPSPPLESPALGFTPVMNSLTEEFSLEPSEASSYVGSDYMYDD